MVTFPSKPAVAFTSSPYAGCVVPIPTREAEESNQKVFDPVMVDEPFQKVSCPPFAPPVPDPVTGAEEQPEMIFPASIQRAVVAPVEVVPTRILPLTSKVAVGLVVPIPTLDKDVSKSRRPVSMFKATGEVFARSTAVALANVHEAAFDVTESPDASPIVKLPSIRDVPFTSRAKPGLVVP